MILFLFIVNRATEKADANGYCLLQMISILTHDVTLFDPILALIGLGFYQQRLFIHSSGNTSQFLCIAQNNKEWTIPAVISNILALCYKNSRTMQILAQQDEGWPLGLLQPENARIELVRNSNNAGSISFNTSLTRSPSSSTDSSSDLDTESTGSFFPDQSTTLGSLMGVSSILELSRRSLRGTKTELLKSKKKMFNFSSWLFCLGSRSKITEAENQKNNPPSLGQFLAVERRAANENRRNQSLPIYDPHDELALADTNNIAERNSLFMNRTIAPPHSISPRQSIGTERENMELRQQNKGFGSLAELFSCMCGQYGFG